MAAVTAATLTRESVGSLTLHIATFTSVDTSTYKSGLPNVVGYWGTAPVKLGVDVTVTGSTGATFDLVNHTATEATLYILSRT